MLTVRQAMKAAIAQEDDGTDWQTSFQDNDVLDALVWRPLGRGVLHFGTCVRAFYGYATFQASERSDALTCFHEPILGADPRSCRTRTLVVSHPRCPAT